MKQHYPASKEDALPHVAFLIEVRSRVRVALQWLWAYAAYQRGARLISPPTSAAD